MKQPKGNPNSIQAAFYLNFPELLSPYPVKPSSNWTAGLRKFRIFSSDVRHKPMWILSLKLPSPEDEIPELLCNDSYKKTDYLDECKGSAQEVAVTVNTEMNVIS